MEFRQIDLQQLDLDLQAGKALVDVREDDEYAQGHVPAAISIPMSEIADRLDDLPDGPLNIICQAGGRSQRVCEFLAQNGYDVSNVAGGTGAWIAEGLAVLTGTERG